MRIAALLRRLRRPSQDDLQALRTYRAQAEPLLHKAGAQRDEWVLALRDQEDGERLANQAAVYRWETGRLAEALAAIDPPPIVADDHRQLAEALQVATRAYHLLANGTRFHKSDVVCEGQDLLLTSTATIDATRQAWDELAAKAAPS